MEKKTNKSWLWLVAILLLTIGTASIIWYGKQKNNFRNSAAPRPIWPLGVDSLSQDTFYFKLPEFIAMNADSTLVSTKDMDGKVTVVETFFQLVSQYVQS